MKVKDILKTKGPEVITIHDEKMVFDAMEVLVKNRIGSLLALNQQFGAQAATAAAQE